MLAAASLPVPEHIDGIDLMPYLTGKKKGDIHEYIYWLNSDPTDAKHRHVVAVRWKNWRLYRHEEADVWQLFDLRKDPREENNVAGRFPEIVDQLAKKHTAWKETLVPRLEKDPDAPVYRSPGPVTPDGRGWVITDGKAIPEKVKK